MDVAMQKKMGKTGTVCNRESLPSLHIGHSLKLLSQPSHSHDSFGSFTVRVLIKGDIATGKTSLFRRLQAKPFSLEHQRTRELQAAHIHWKYKNDNMKTAKVEVWDVVDKSTNSEAAKGDQAVYYLNSNANQSVTGEVDADCLDVYRGSNALVILTDPSRRSTFDYLNKVLADPALPKDFPIAILCSFRDKRGEKEEITMKDFEEVLAADPKNRFFFQCSMRSCFGLKELYEFISVPYLKLLEKDLLMRLEDTRQELSVCGTEMNTLSKAQDYDAFLTAAGQAQSQSQAPPEPQVEPVQGNPLVKSVVEEPEENPSPPQPVAKNEYDDISDDEASPKVTQATPPPKHTATVPEVQAPSSDVPTGKPDSSNFNPTAAVADSDSDSDSSDGVPAVAKSSALSIGEPNVVAVGTGVAAIDDFDAGDLDDGFWDD